jgi:hypothetical protein
VAALGDESALLIHRQRVEYSSFTQPVGRQITDRGEGNPMDEAGKNSESQSDDRPGSSAEETAVKTVARKVGSAIGTISAKVSGAAAKPSANAYDSRRLEIKKHKRSAHRRKLKSSHTKG